MKTDLDTRDPMSLAIDRAERDAASSAQLSKRARALAGRIRTSQTHDRLPSAPPPQQQGFTIGAALSLDSWTLAQSSAPGLRVATSPSSLLLAESRGFLVLEPAAEARAAALGDYMLHPAGEAASPRGQGGISLLTAGIHKVRGNLGPGALALPAAFAKVGPVVGLVGLAVVCLPGIYGFITLVRLKRELNAAGAGVKTFEDLAFRSFGLLGRRVLESTVVLLQLGVVTVYMGVLSSAACAIDAAPCEDGAPLPRTVACVAAVVLPVSMVREIASLMPLSLPGNLAILAAVVGSVGCAVSLLIGGGGRRRRRERHRDNARRRRGGRRGGRG